MRVLSAITRHGLFCYLAICLSTGANLAWAIPATAAVATPTNTYSETASISSNPGAVNIVTGSGDAQAYVEKILGITNDHGIRFGGMWIGDANDLLSGGVPHADKWTLDSLLLLDLSVDTEKFIGWKGGLFDIEFLQFNGQSTNAQAGSAQGYNSLPGPQPLNRSELYEFWYRQVLFDNKFIVRIGKTVPTYEFGNVMKPVPLAESRLFIPAVTGLIYTPIFVNASMLGVLPGYYNSAYGITLNFVPVKRWYLSYGVYDGNLAQGKQTGLTGPTFNGNYFQVAETGFTWLLGKNKMPGNIGIGAWHQSGLVQTAPTVSEHGTSGYYILGTQRLWYRNSLVNNSGISGFYQYGRNDSTAMLMTQYIGAGLTAFGLVPNRANDSMGTGVAFSWLNQQLFNRPTELMVQAYYQAQVVKDIYVEPVLSYIPTPGAGANPTPAWAGTLRAMVLF